MIDGEKMRTLPAGSAQGNAGARTVKAVSHRSMVELNGAVDATDALAAPPAMFVRRSAILA